MFTIKAMRRIALIVHNVRSAHNVGSILRSADGLGASKVYLTGYSPYPAMRKDSRLPHIAAKLDQQIHKTALGAEKSVSWHHKDDIYGLLHDLKTDGYQIVALEQTKKAINLREFTPRSKIALIVGSEIGGIDPKILGLADKHIQIPMRGNKESFNVAVASALALYHLRNLA